MTKKLAVLLVENLSKTNILGDFTRSNSWKCDNKLVE